MEEMAEAVREEGPSVEQDNEIYKVAQANSEVADLLRDYRKTLR